MDKIDWRSTYPLFGSRFFKESSVLLDGINYCSAWAAWIKLFTYVRKEKHHKVAGVDLLFLPLLGFPEGSSMKLIKSNKSRKTLGEEAHGNKLHRITWLHTFVLLDKNTQNHRIMNHCSGSLKSSHSHYVILLHWFFDADVRSTLLWNASSLNSICELAKSQVDQLRTGKKKKKKEEFLTLSLRFSSNMCHHCWPVSVGKPDGNFYYPHWSNNDVRCERSTANAHRVVSCRCVRVVYKT